MTKTVTVTVAKTERLNTGADHHIDADHHATESNYIDSSSVFKSVTKQLHSRKKINALRLYRTLWSSERGLLFPRKWVLIFAKGFPGFLFEILDFEAFCVFCSDSAPKATSGKASEGDERKRRTLTHNARKEKVGGKLRIDKRLFIIFDNALAFGGTETAG